MKTILKILGEMDGDHTRIQNEPYMPLVVERLGAKGPRGWPLISVAHYGEMNGDAMRDPEMVFELATPPADWPDKTAKQKLLPVYFRNDYAGLEQFAVTACEGGYYGNPTDDGRFRVNRGLVRQLEEFARMWNRNIREQGFLEAAKKATA